MCDIIEKENSDIVCVQETMLSNITQLRINNYSLLHRKGHHRRKWPGCAAILVQETVSVKEIQVNTPLQTVAAQVNIGFFNYDCVLYTTREAMK